MRTQTHGSSLGIQKCSRESLLLEDVEFQKRFQVDEVEECLILSVSLFQVQGPNQQTRELISASKASYKQNNKDLSCLRQLSPCMQVNTKYINSTEVHGSGNKKIFACCVWF